MVDVEIELYEECKYHASREVLENPKKVRINNVTYWTIITGKDAEEIERYSDIADDYHEYLELTFEGNKKGTFRNSYVDMFIVKYHR